MIFLPFSQEALRFRRRKIFTGVTVVSVGMALLFPLPLYPTGGDIPSGSLVGNLFMLCAILLMLAAYIWLVRDTLIKKVLVFYTVVFYAATQYLLVNVFSPLLFSMIHGTGVPVYNINDVLLYAVTAALLLPLELVMVIRPLGEVTREIDPRTMKREFFVTILSMTACFILMLHCNMVWRVNFGGEQEHLRWLLPLYLFLIGNQAVIFWLVFRESVRRKRDNDRQRAMEVQQLQYEKIAGEIENTRRMRHDLRHHYNSLIDMLKQGKLDEMQKYLAQVIDSTVKRSDDVYCRNMTVNSLLQYYAGMARGEDIRCDIHAECDELPIDPVDLTVLFGNAMENAIHACRKCPKNRWIDLQVGMVSGSLAIEISNSCTEARINRRFQTEDGFSPAEAFQSDREGGGYGLRSLSYTAQKYDGSARFRFNAEAETFTTRIRLNVKMN